MPHVTSSERTCCICYILNHPKYVTFVLFRFKDLKISFKIKDLGFIFPLKPLNIHHMFNDYTNNTKIHDSSHNWIEMFLRFSTNSSKFVQFFPNCI